MGYERDYRRDDRHRGEQGRWNRDQDDDRGFFDRASDEVRSWFGDEEAERRRRYDERAEQGDRGYGRQGYGGQSRSDQGRGDYGRGGYGASGQARGGYGSGGYGRSDYDRGSASGSDYARQDAGRGGYGTQEGGRANYGASDYGRGGYGSQERGRGGYGAGGGTYGDYDRGGYGETGFGSSSAGWSQQAGRSSEGTDDYGRWRNQQIDALDRDYDEYRRENQSKFDSEFSTWRTRRQGQRQHLERIEEHMEVVGSDGKTIGKVDKVRGDRVILTKNDDPEGHHHSFSSSWIDTVDGEVKLSKTADEARKAWKDEDRRQPLSGDRGSDEGARNLDRSFSGTY